MKYEYTKGKLSLRYELQTDMFFPTAKVHTLLVRWNGELTGVMSLYNKKKKPDIGQFYESLELVDKRFYKTFSWSDEWGDVINDFDLKIKVSNKLQTVKPHGVPQC